MTSQKATKAATKKTATKKTATKKAAKKPAKAAKQAVTPTGKQVTGSAAAQTGPPRCGLCGKTTQLTKTSCCGNWICDDESNYVMFSYARNSCHRNHDRYTLCSYHYHERHAGADWRACAKCRASFDTEDYVDMATNEYNFVKLANPPKFAPTKCAKCKAIIKRAEGGYSIKGKEFFCMKCRGFDFFR